MKHAPIRHTLEYLPYLALSRILERMDLGSVRRLGRRLGLLWHAVDARHRRVADRNLQLALPELDREQRVKVIRDCYAHFGATFFELFPAGRLSAREVEERFEIHGWHHLEAARDRGRGVLVLSGHYGSWQLATYPIGHRLGGLHLVVRPPDNPKVAADVARLRERFRNVMLPRGGAGHRVLSTIRSGGVVGLVIDQRVPPLTGILVPFLGLPARSTQVPAYVALKTGAPAVPLTATPIDEQRYRIDIRAPIDPAPVEGEAHPEVALTRLYFEAIEHEIRQRPELWLWMHDRWKLHERERAAWERGEHELTSLERAEIRERVGWKPDPRD